MYLLKCYKEKGCVYEVCAHCQIGKFSIKKEKMGRVLQINLYAWEEFKRSVCTSQSVTKERIVFMKSVLAVRLENLM